MNKVIDIVRRDQLLDNVNHVGNILHQGFLEMSKETDGMVNSARGRGLFRSLEGVSKKKDFERKFIIRKIFSEYFRKNIFS